jgi:hypothetical protein
METIAEGNVWSRVSFLISERTIQRVCPYFPGCNYVEKQRETKEITHEGKTNYSRYVCTEYPGACEQNLDARFSKSTKLSGEEIHELLR